MKRKGILIILSSPSGAGKTSIARALVSDNKNLSFSVSATTRKPRPGEKDGREYHFVSNDIFELKRKRNEFLEWAEVFGNLYGTPKNWVASTISKGFDVILELDVQGALQVKDVYPDAKTIFIIPTSYEDLKDRLVKRGLDSRETIEKRIIRKPMSGN